MKFDKDLTFDLLNQGMQADFEELVWFLKKL
jgi:hypothetical protein